LNHISFAEVPYRCVARFSFRFLILATLRLRRRVIGDARRNPIRVETDSDSVSSRCGRRKTKRNKNQCFELLVTRHSSPVT
jgi:hypothetical protein